ncbi:hypothetical protein AB5V95_00520 [Metamycoplasma spumans]|uniref:hypothetical protein n=1 Tax=Metamycoplasma spumans TaxID=92406 RepID=UPI00048163C0
MTRKFSNLLIISTIVALISSIMLLSIAILYEQNKPWELKILAYVFLGFYLLHLLLVTLIYIKVNVRSISFEYFIFVLFGFLIPIVQLFYNLILKLKGIDYYRDNYSTTNIKGKKYENN